MNGEIVIVDNVPQAFGEFVAEAFATRANPESFSIALSGGSSAGVCYEQLAGQPIDWACVTALWGDERCVPLDHSDSNYLLAKNALFDRVAPLAAVHPMRCDLGANAYEAIVARALPIDVVHLGMGEDGHAASLFPASAELDVPPERLVVETGDDLHRHRRLTFTFSALGQARLVLFTVKGAGKREMFARIRNGEQLPAGRVNAQRVVWLVDEAAAG